MMTCSTHVGQDLRGIMIRSATGGGYSRMGGLE